MMPANVFQIDIASKLTPRRGLLIRLGLPMLLAMPFALTAMPAKAKSSGMVMLVLFVALLGAAVAAVRRRTDGLSERLATLPIPRWLVAADLLLASSVMDLAQLAGPVAVFVLAAGRLGVSGLVVLAGLLSAVVVLLNALGLALAAVMKGNSEVHLAGALSVGLIAAGSGLFPLPGRLEGAIAASSGYNPVSLLATALGRSVDGTLDAGPTETLAAATILALVLAAVAARAANRPDARRPGWEKA